MDEDKLYHKLDELIMLERGISFQLAKVLEEQKSLHEHVLVELRLIRDGVRK